MTKANCPKGQDAKLRGLKSADHDSPVTKRSIYLFLKKEGEKKMKRMKRFLAAVLISVI